MLPAPLHSNQNKQIDIWSFMNEKEGTCSQEAARISVREAVSWEGRNADKT